MEKFVLIEKYFAVLFAQFNFYYYFCIQINNAP